MENAKLTVVDVVRLVELVDKVQKRGHYTSINYSNYGSNVEVYFMRNGFRAGIGYDFSKSFCLTDKDHDIDAYHEIVTFFLTVVEEAKEMTVEEIEEVLGYKICIVDKQVQQ